MVAAPSSTLLTWHGPHVPDHPLAALAPGSVASIVAVKLEDELKRWLAALGIGCGDRVVVLRRAPFGGPIHLRTHTGGEFAVDQALARDIRVNPAQPEALKGAV